MTAEAQDSADRSTHTLFSGGAAGGLTEEELLERFTTGGSDPAGAAFTALVALHGPMVWGVCRGVLADPHEAQDAFQATFLVFVRKARSIRHRDSVGPWLYGVARRVAVRAKAVEGRRRSRERPGTEAGVAQTEDTAHRERFEALHEEIGRLPEKYRAPVVFCHLEGRTHVEAARLLNCPVGTVSVRLARARERLRAGLTRRGLALPAAWGVATFLPADASAAVPAGLIEATAGLAKFALAGKATAAGAVSAEAVRLAAGGFKAMSFSKLAVTAAWAVGTGAFFTGVGLLAWGGKPAGNNPKAASARVATPPAAGGQSRINLKPLRPIPSTPDEAAARRQSRISLRQIGRALHLYHAAEKSFPPPAITSRDGTPLLSWRVALLPYLNARELYDQFKRDETWDGPHNKGLLERMPLAYASPGGPRPPYATYYRAFVGKGALFEAGRTVRLADVTDGTSNTLAVVEAGEPVPWTKPDEVPYDPGRPLPRLGGLFPDGFNALFANGAVQFFSREDDPALLRAYVTRDGMEAVPPPSLQEGEGADDAPGRGAAAPEEPFSGRVVFADDSDRGVAGALVEGVNAEQLGDDFVAPTGADGRFQGRRHPARMVVRAATADGSAAGFAEVGRDAKRAVIRVSRTATASGLLLNGRGEPVAGQELLCGRHVYLGDEGASPFRRVFAPRVATDAAGRFKIPGLVVGYEYHLSQTKGLQTRTVAIIRPRAPGPLDLGRVRAYDGRSDEADLPAF